MKRFVCFLLALSYTAFAEDGAALYRKHCAMCHDSIQSHAPSFQALQAMSEQAILRILETGTMREQAKDLSAQERKTLAGYLGTARSATGAAPTAAYCHANAAQVSSSSADWNGFGAGLTNARFQTKEAAGLSAADIPKLKLKWAFGLGEITIARGQPVVVGNRLFTGTAAGKLYSLDAHTGCIDWVFDADSAIRSGVVVGNKAAGGPSLVFFADAKANAYAVDGASGKLVWKVHPESHVAAMITDAPAYYGGTVYLGISSLEELFGGDPKYECCTFRGSVVALDAATGAIVWKTLTVAEQPKATRKNAAGVQQYGPSGAGVWSTPTVDLKRNAIYAATGDNYSNPSTDTSDAVLALDRSTGKMLWSRQMTTNDAYNMACYAADRSNCPDMKGPDFDFGQPPILVSLADGKDALVIGQKSGVAWAIDPDQHGRVLWQTRVGKGGELGGSQWGSATDGRNMYVAISDIGFRDYKDVAQPSASKYELDPSKGGGLFAIDLSSGNKVWNANPAACGERKNCSPAQPAAVSAIPGVVFLGSLDGHFRAYSSTTGDVIWDFDTAREYETVNGQKGSGGAMDGGGAAIAGGMVYVNSGYNMWGEMPGNVVLAFSIDGK